MVELQEGDLVILDYVTTIFYFFLLLAFSVQRVPFDLQFLFQKQKKKKHSTKLFKKLSNINRITL